MTSQQSERKTDLLPRLIGIVWVVLIAAISIAVYQPRGITPATAPATEFSAERASRHVWDIARKPHPVGSAEHARVRDYLLHELTELGLDPSIQKTMAVLGAYGTAATVENVIARMRGSTAGPAVMLVAHYDSVPAGPGAADDAAGVATVLETARALAAGAAAGTRPRNDVILLFTDGEELGLLGAAAFVAEHPWKSDVGVALNFDNRGTRGAVLMYETSAGNLALLREMAHDVRSPRASSLSSAVAQLMPNSTDFFDFRKAGIAGLNFAFIGGVDNYHTMQDSPANLDLRTLQQAGDYALPLARSLANEDLSRFTARTAPSAVFFNPVGGWEIVYPESWARPLGIIALVLFLGVSALAFARGFVRLGGFAGAVAICVVSLLAAWRIGDWFGLNLPRLHGDGGFPGPYLFQPIYSAALYLLVAGITFALWEIAAVRWEEIAVAGAGVWTVLGTVAAFAQPAASYLLCWPLIPVLIALGLHFATHRNVAEKPGASAAVLVLLGVIPAVLLFGPLLPALHLALGMSAYGAPGQALVIALSLWLLAPVLAPEGKQYGEGVGRLALLVLIAGATVFALGVTTVRYNDHHPRPEWIAYVKDVDRDTAQWFSAADANAPVSSPHMDAWRKQYLGETPAITHFPISLPWRGELLCWTHDAPKLELAAPEAEILSDKTKDGSRVLSLRLRPQQGTARLAIEATAQQISSVVLNGREMRERRFSAATASIVTAGGKYRPRTQRESWNLLYSAPPEGLELQVTVPEGSPLELTLADVTDGLPAIPSQTFSPRPPSVTQRQLADMTVVIKSFAF